MYVQPLEGSLSPNSLASPPANAEAGGTLFPGSGSISAGDNISRFVPPWLENGEGGSEYGNSGSMQTVFGSLMGLLQQLMQMLQSLTGYGCSPSYGCAGSPPNGYASYGNGCQPYGNGCQTYGHERYFQNATGSSEGDPHLSFNGAKWNNMGSQPDLLNSDSFAGGFRISTRATQPNDKGATWNQSATVTLNNGATRVSMNDNGQASITSDGRQIEIDRGQTMQLGNGESVTYEQNGALRVTAENGSGGRIETTFTPEGKGVNVDVTAHDVDLGGALVNGYEGRGIPGPTPSPGPILGPSPEPIPAPPFPIPEPIGRREQPDY